jgi:hypothetical protein
MAAQDLVGPPRGSLAFPTLTLTYGWPQTSDKLNSERAEWVDGAATPVAGAGNLIDGSITINLLDTQVATAAEAFKKNEAAIREGRDKEPTRQLHAAFSEILGSNDALVVPIESKGLFPETLVSVVTARTYPEPRPQWRQYATKSAIQADGWVFTWPSSEHLWFKEHCSASGLSGMISHMIEKRKEPVRNYVWSETVGTLKQPEIEKMLAAFRERAGVKAERVEPFSVPRWQPLQKVAFVAAGEPAHAMAPFPSTDASVSVSWDHPVIKQVTGGSGYAINSGTSICTLLPGPADPELIRLLVLRSIDPDEEAAKEAR